MASEERKHQIKQQVLPLYDQYAYWYELYMEEDHDGALEEEYNQKQQFYRKQYQGLILEYCDWDYGKSMQYTDGASREGLMKFLREAD